MENENAKTLMVLTGLQDESLAMRILDGAGLDLNVALNQ
jgi:hypothetical protein